LTSRVRVLLTGFLLGIVLLSLMLLLVKPEHRLPPHLQASLHDSIDDCPGKPDATSRADCFFQDIANVLQNQQEWSNWTPLPAGGMDNLDCSVPTASKLPQNFLNSFVILTQFPSQDTALDIRHLPSGRKTAAAASGSRSSSAQSVSSISGSGIFFNENARSYLCGLAEPSTSGWVSAALTMRASATPQESIGFQPAPIIFVKPLWYLVPIDPGYESIPVWDADYSLLTGPTGTPLSNWKKTLVSLDDVSRTPCDFKYTGWNVSRPSISIGCFFSIPLTEDQCAQVTKQAGTVAAEPAAIDVGRTGCHLVLMAFNLSAKIGSLWTWQTYWWSSRAEDNSSPDSKLRVSPPSSDGRWRFYVMDTGDSHPLFNPYLEGSLVGGTTTDCSQCHQKAEFRSVSPPNDALVLCLFTHASNVIAPQGSCQTSGENIQSLITDSVWSLADVNVPFASRKSGSR
jgi:hypothetical protein